jgi:RNA polymerase sigma-70 factor (ECF subfamily)
MEGDALEAMHREAESAWPRVSVPFERFAEAVRAAVASGVDPAELHAKDLYLAVACLAGEATAVNLLEREVIRAVRPSVERACRDGSVAPDDALQTTLERLLVPADGEPPKLSLYTGRGPLVGWVRVVAVREALQGRRRSQRQRAREDSAADDEAALGPVPIELKLLRARHDAAFGAAVKKAFSELTAEQRMLLRFSALEGLTIDEMAPLVGVHRATVARRLERARAEVFERTRAILRADHGLSESEARSLCLALASEVDVSLARALGAGAASP